MPQLRALSAKTKRSFGWRSMTRENEDSESTKTLDTGLVVAATAAANAGFIFGGSGDCSSRDAPACKQTGTPNSSQADQNGSYSGPLTWGTSRKCIGSDGKITPRCPLATARLTSAIAA